MRERLFPFAPATREQAPSQEPYVDLKRALSQMGGEPGSVLLDRALGYTLSEISARTGIQMSKVARIEAAAREHLSAVFGEAA